MIDLVEVLDAWRVEPPEAEHEREGDQPEQEEGVTPVEAAGGLAQVRVCGIR